MNDNFAKISLSPEHFLLQIDAQEDKSVNSLKSWIDKNQQFLKEKIAIHGGIFLKGFDINTASDFEAIAKTIEPNLCDKHPFNGDARTWVTQYAYEVASPSIKKSSTPRAFHNEDSFTSLVPKTIMFCSLEPAAWGGQTLLADCRKVFNALPDKLKKKYIAKSVECKLVLHDDVFLINSRVKKNENAIIEAGKAYGAEEVERISEDVTRFTFRMPAVIKYDASDAPVWFNLIHQPVFFSYQLYVDTWFAYSYMKGYFNKLKACYLIALSFLKDLKFYLKTLIKKEKVDEYCLLDKDKISIWERIQMNLAFWKSKAILPLQKGEIIILDNRLVAHARMPYVGRRVLLSCMGSLTKLQGFYQK